MVGQPDTSLSEPGERPDGDQVRGGGSRARGRTAVPVRPAGGRSSETGPAVRRFGIATGRQVGKDLAIPKELRYWPQGSAQTGRSIEALALSPDGRHLYAGWEAPLAEGGDQRGRGIIRIQRYTGTPGGTYTPDRQSAFLADDNDSDSQITRFYSLAVRLRP
ncbi:esterase-like activity of phytase family protein [Streptomyces sp. NPDC005921]|uniref:esterase-like activity of phytase family protein n=1 Tax=Streptomyces sp. NPDC005827 TaxID=3157070 RepID=UPI003405075B